MRKGLWTPFIGTVALLAAASGHAQSITLTSPTSSSTVHEGDDFYTTVMNDPADFADRRDFMWEQNFSEPTISASAGVWSGVFASTGGYVFPLFPGFGGTTAFWNIGRTGERFPIDTAKYRYLSLRRRVSNRSIVRFDVGQSVGWPMDMVCQANDGYYLPGALIWLPANQWTVDLYDFRQTTAPRCENFNPSKWTGQIRGISFHPAATAPAGTSADFDWVRIVDPSSAPQVTISWNTAGAPTSSAVNVYVDTDGSGFDGAFLGRVKRSAGSSFVLPSAALPPGAWRFYVELRDDTSSDALLARSGYSGTLTINAGTQVRVDEPSMTSGPDYATEMLGNPWDFSDSADVLNLNWPDVARRFTNASFSGGLFTALASGPVPPAGESDVQIYMNTGSRPIPTWRYRYLSYRMSVDGTGYGDVSDRVGRGHIFRPIWWTDGLDVDGSEGRGVVDYEGMRTYVGDLADPRVLSTDNPGPSQKGWQGLPAVRTLRLDPGEFPMQTWFSFDDVRLRAKPEPTSANQFTVRVTTSDREGNSATLQFYRDTDNTGFNGTLIGTLSNRAPGSHALSFSTASFFPQDMWIYVVATDSAGNVSRQYGDAPLRVGPQVWQPFFAVDPLETPYVGDFNGDGRTDIITFTRQNPLAVGDVYVALSNGSQFVDKYGTPGSSDKWHDWFAISTAETVVIGDYNGDGRDDIATWLGASTRQVYVALSQGTGMGKESVWLSSIGVSPSDVLMSGDANGDGRKDLILFARSQGRVYVALSNGSGFGPPSIWHGWFAVSTYERPRVADVTGDGRADIVTFATDSPTAQGDVYVAISDGSRFTDASGQPNNSTKWHDWFAVDSSQEVRIGDIDNDGRDDFFTFLRWPFGQAYVVKSQGSSMGPNNLWMSDGMVYSDTDKVHVGDVTGDGKADIILFRQVPGRVEVVRTP